MEDWWFDLIGPDFFLSPRADIKLTYVFSKYGSDDLNHKDFLDAFRATGHEDAEWFFGLFPNGIDLYDEGAKSDAKKILVAQPEDGRSLFFASKLCLAPEAIIMLKKSISMGYTRSYGEICGLVAGESREFWLEGARKGCDSCCWYLCVTRGCSSAHIYAERGARLGNKDCMLRYSETLSFENPVRWLITYTNLVFVYSRVTQNNTWFKNADKVKDKSALFYIGELTICGFVNGVPTEDSSLYLVKSRILSYHAGVLNAVRDECVCWVMIAHVLGVNKDVRKVISKMIWKSRFEGRKKEIKEDGGLVV